MKLKEESEKTWLKTQCTGREVVGGFRMGNMCTPVVDSCLCMAKPIQYCKVKKKKKLLLQKIQITVSSLIISCQIDGETMETVTGFIFLGSNSLQMVTAVT